MSRSLSGIQFGLLTDEQIRSLAVVEVTESTLHSKGGSKANSPADSRFGTCNRFSVCGTCRHSVMTCPGHPGFISMPYPLPHVAYIQYLTRTLNLFCFNCSTFLLPGIKYPSRVQTAKKKLIYAYEEAKKARMRKRCPLTCPNPECQLPQPTVYIEEPFVRLSWRDDVLESHFGPEVVGTSLMAANQPKRRKKAVGAGGANDNAVLEDDAEDKASEGQGQTKRRKTKVQEEKIERTADMSPEEARLDLDRRKGEYEFFVKRQFTNHDAYNVLRSISKTDLTILGIDGNHTHPLGMMLMSLLVPAIGTRPTVSFDEGSKRRGFHQLTRKIAEIVKQKRSLLVEAANCKIRLDDSTLSVKFPESLVTAIQQFYCTVSHYLVKDKCKVPNLKLSPYAARAHARSISVSQGLNGKHGRYRAHLMGKRVDFCLRTVVTPNPNADIDEIGIPRELAKRLTVPIRVTAYNRAGLQKLMSQGGVMQVVDERTGNMIAIGEHNKDSLALMDGWVCERFLKDNDWLVVNRQPTLHRPSVMGHRVKIHDERTLRLSDACMGPYNADCDGDEMNAHVAQTCEARSEVQELLAVSNHLIHPRANRPCIGLIQDTLDAGYFFTRDGQWFDKHEAMNLLMAIHYDRDAPDAFSLGKEEAKWTERRLPPPGKTDSAGPRWSGKQIASCAIPRINMQLKLQNRPANEVDTVLRIVDGQIVSGTLCKQSLGASNGGIIHHVCMYCGNNTAARFISDIKRLLNRFMVMVGFSIGIRDCMTDIAVQRKVDVVIDAAEKHVATIKEIAKEMPDDPIVQDLAEMQISDTLKSLLHMVGNVVRVHLDETNTFNVMANLVASKGSLFNMSQTMALVGQTFVNGKRPQATGSNRILPSAPLPGQAPLSIRDELRMHGFIRRPYKSGLSMQDAFINNAGGREGLVDTAAKTSRTGYIQRRIVKAMESHCIAHDGSVRDAFQKQFQRFFGNDGLDPMKTLKVTLDYLMLNNAKLRERCVSSMLPPLSASREWVALRGIRDECRDGKITVFQPNLSQNTSVYIPFNVTVLLEKQRPNAGPMPAKNLVRAVKMVDSLCKTIDSEVPSQHTIAHIREQLASQKMVDRKLSIGAVEAICSDLLQMHRAARMQPGEGVGALTATSTGEPATQMTLNTFHTAGSANRGMTHGVPRLKEIIGASRNLSTPIMTLPLKKGLPNPKQAAEVLARGLPYTMLRNVTLDTATIYEPDILATHIEADRALIAQHAPFLDYIQGRCCNWVIRIVLCKTRAGARSLEPRSIADLIQDELGDSVLVIASRVDCDEWVVRVYFVDVEETVDQALKKSMATGTTRTATKRASQRVSLTRKRRKFADFSGFESGQDKDPVLPVPLHRIDPHVGRTVHRPRDVVEWMMIRNSQQELNNICVCGMKDISDASVRICDCSDINADTGAVTITEEYVVDVMGSNLTEASMLEAVDQRRISSNDVMAVFETLGITAASQVLFQELKACLGACSRVDDRLISLVTSVMCHNGFVMPISRHGLNRLREHGILAKVCFEETLEQLFEAGSSGLFDPLLGVSENVMVGRKAKIGSNLSRMMVDTDTGERVKCVGNSTASAGPDTRVLTSVVTESACDEFEEIADDDVPDPDRVDRLLMTKNVQAEHILSAPTAAGGEYTSTGLYQQHFFHRPGFQGGLPTGGTQVVGFPPIPEVDETVLPFRPSSPSLFAEEEDLEKVAEEPFKPSSPDLSA